MAGVACSFSRSIISTFDMILYQADSTSLTFKTDSVADLGFLEGGFCCTLVREILEATPTCC